MVFPRGFICVAIIVSLTSCLTRHEGQGINAYFAVGSTEKQVIKSMGLASRITLDGDIEYWHYGDSWVAMAAHRVAKYNNQGSLRVEKLATDGTPGGIDLPDVKPPPNDNINKAPKFEETQTVVRIQPKASRQAPSERIRTMDQIPSTESNPRGQWVQ